MEQFPLESKYHIKQKLGQGGFGEAYLALLKSNQTLCVLKKLATRDLNNWKELELFEREAKILQQLDHPGIPYCTEIFCQDADQGQELYIVQDYIPGKNLRQWIDSGRRFSETKVIEVALEICDILTYLHTLQPPVIHRDIKPNNLIMNANEKVFLIDFGAVKESVKSSQERGSTVIGTFGYMAPEQFDGRAYAQTDLYALGCTLLFLLSHQDPTQFEKEGLKIKFQEKLTISKGLNHILERLLEPDWKTRYDNTQALTKDLLALKSGKYKKRKHMRRPQNYVIGSVMGLALIGGGIFFLNPSKQAHPTTSPETTQAKVPKQVIRYLSRPQTLTKCDATPESVTEIHKAVRDFKINQVAGLIDNGGNINAKDSKGWRPIHYAMKNYPSSNSIRKLIALGAKRDLSVEVALRDIEGIDQELKKGSSPNMDLPGCHTLLHMAITTNNTAIATRLIQAGADIHATNAQGRNSLSLTTSRNTELTHLLIAKGADINHLDHYQKSPLHYAVTYRKVKVAQQLITAGADVNQADTYLSSPLHVAAKRTKKPELSTLLIQAGANINALNKYSQTPLHQAVYEQNKAIAELLIKHGAQTDIFTDAALGRLPQVQQKLNQTPQGANAVLGNSLSLLNMAIAGGDLEVVQYLLQQGASPNHIKKHKNTPLYVAANRGNLKLVTLLIQHGAYINQTARSYAGTALYIAARQGHYQVVEYLLNKGADIHVGTGIYNPIKAATQGRHAEVLSLLKTHEKKTL